MFGSHFDELILLLLIFIDFVGLGFIDDKKIVGVHYGLCWV